MPHSNSSSQDWFYHSTGKNKPKETIDQPPASQIPGLSSVPVYDELESDETSKRKWIRDTDSKYVRLAKAGGRKDLFQYREHRPSDNGPHPYPRVDWFDHYYDEQDNEHIQPQHNKERFKSSMPDWYVHDNAATEEEKEDDDFERERPLLAFDDMSIWKREDNDAKYEGKKRGISKKMANKSPQKIPVPVMRPKPEKEDIHHLLSMGYQRDWLQEREKQEQISTKNKHKEKAIKLQAKAAHSKPQIHRKMEDSSQEEKPLFKMTRFSNIPSKINTFRT